MNESQQRTDVLVLMGGPDAEREVSLSSGREVAAALREASRPRSHKGEPGRPRPRPRTSGLVARGPSPSDSRKPKADNPFTVIEAVIDAPSASELAELGGDVIFPVLHGRWGEGGPLQRELDLLGKPYVGSGAEAAALAMDKLHTKTLLARDNVRTPVALEISRDDQCRLGPPLVLKPIDDGSSVDIRICHTIDEIEQARRELHPKRDRLMAEEYIAGRELTVGIVSGRLLPIVEIIPTVSFYDYDAKYDRDDTRYVIDPELPKEVRRECLEYSEIAWQRINCRDVARVDFRLDEDGRLWFLEINTMPGFTTHSLVPMAARAAGLEMPDLCAALVEAAMERGATSPAGAPSVSPTPTAVSA